MVTMPNTYTPPTLTFDHANNRYHCEGSWSILMLTTLPNALRTTDWPTGQALEISGKHVRHFDSAGALTLLTCLTGLKQQSNHVTLIDFTPQQTDLLALVDSKQAAITYIAPIEKKQGPLYTLGKETVNKIAQIDGLLILIGDLTRKLAAGFHHPRRFQYPSIVSNIYSTGITALPILALLSFLIGVVLAYQMGLQLETYGATIFIAYLSGMAIFREFGPLITAIIVAGRTSSAFTAQIGSMKLNEEIDALHTMGLSPTELLVVPKVLGLLIAFPLLIFWADLFGSLGAMFMSKYMLHVNYGDFLMRLQDAVGLKQLMLGLYKAPVFALLIALVGCFQGFRVGTSADSVGSQTTKSVVQSLFLIIITDATYSIIYSWLDL